MTTYVVCPHCRTVHAVEGTISEATYRVWLVVRACRGRLHLANLATDAGLSYEAFRRHVNKLADAGLIERVPQGGKYAKRRRHWYRVMAPVIGAQETVRDSAAAGEGREFELHTLARRGV